MKQLKILGAFFPKLSIPIKVYDQNQKLKAM
jgi:hypothetical protein